VSLVSKLEFGCSGSLRQLGADGVLNFELSHLDFRSGSKAALGDRMHLVRTYLGSGPRDGLGRGQRRANRRHRDQCL